MTLESGQPTIQVGGNNGYGIQALRDRVQNLEANERFQGLFARMNGLPFGGC